MPPPKEFADDEVSEALQTLGLMLLRINAGKTSQVKSNSALMKLTKELAEASRAIHELPDSDDDDDDEEVDADSDDDKDENNRRKSYLPRGSTRIPSSLICHLFYLPCRAIYPPP